jgi:hypothetical protein
MVVANFFRLIVFPVKTNAPLIVNADTELPIPVARQLFKSVGRKQAQFVNALCGISHAQLSSGDCLNMSRQCPGKKNRSKPVGLYHF